MNDTAVPTEDKAQPEGGEKRFGWPGWRTALIWYLKLIAITLIAAGIVHWGRLVGYTEWRGLFFWDMPVEWQAATVFFGVADLVAAVGLWLGVSWGAVMWLFRVFCQVVMHTAFSATFGYRPLVITYLLLSVAVYLVLVIRTERDARRQQ